MLTSDILARLKTAGIRLTPLPDGRLWVEPRTALNDELRELIRAHKPQLLRALEQAELARLVNQVADYHGFTEQQRQEALEIALADAVAALDCFRALAARIPTMERMHGSNERA